MVTLEKKLKIPTVAFVAQSFRRDFQSGVRAYGMPSVPMAMVPSEFTSCSDREVQQQATDVIEDIIQALTTPPQVSEEKALRPINTLNVSTAKKNRRAEEKRSRRESSLR